MIRRLEQFFMQAVMLLDVGVITVAFLCTFFLRKHFHAFYRLDLIPGQDLFRRMGSLDSYLWLLLLILPLWVILLYRMGAYQRLRATSPMRIGWILCKANLLGLTLFGTAMFLLRIQRVSRTFMVLFVVTAAVFLWVERFALISYWKILGRRPFFLRWILIVGTGPRAEQLVQTLQRNAAWGLHIAGILDPDPKRVGQSILGMRVMGTLKQLREYLQLQVIDEVIFVLPRGWLTQMEEAVCVCEEMGVRSTIAMDLFNLRVARAFSTDLNGIPAVSFETTPISAWQLAAKRAMDILISTFGLTALSPLLLAVAVLIKLTSPGPVLFRQERCGLNGRRFVMYKFRTMVAGAEERRKELEPLNELTGPVFKIHNDPRLTPLGRWLRKTSGDELPQLWNVLKGEMSIVGPRPPTVEEVGRYEARQRRRLSMRPGITGYWQVSGRNEVKDFGRLLELDLKYIDQWSLGLDAVLLLKTIPAVVFGTGAK